MSPETCRDRSQDAFRGRRLTAGRFDSGPGNDRTVNDRRAMDAVENCDAASQTVRPL